MKLYILRHEDRTMDATLFSPLTENGLHASIKLIEILNGQEIDYIYSSPFIRTLQTIHPYTKFKKLKINIEHSLSEIQHPHIIPEKSFTISLPKYIAKSFNYNKKYTSLLNPINHNYPEDEESVNIRVKAFISKIMNEHLDTKYNIILVTHQIICNAILKIATKKNSDISIDITNNYMKGGLTCVFDTDKWVYKKIN